VPNVTGHHFFQFLCTKLFFDNKHACCNRITFFRYAFLLLLNWSWSWSCFHHCCLPGSAHRHCWSLCNSGQSADDSS